MKMIKVIHLFLFITLEALLLLTGCGLDVNDETRYIKGEGPLVSTIIEVDTFANIIHGSIGSLMIETTDTFAIELRAQQNITDEMTFFVEDNIFYWGINGDVRITDSDSILLHMKIPQALDEFDLTGVGNVEFSGPPQEQINLALKGVGNLLAYKLQVEKADIYLAGSGNVQVWVTDTLTGVLSGAGNVYFKGEPVINLPVYGAGNVIDDN
jgi:hypothetical protein